METARHGANTSCRSSTVRRECRRTGMARPSVRPERRSAGRAFAAERAQSLRVQHFGNHSHGSAEVMKQLYWGVG